MRFVIVFLILLLSSCQATGLEKSPIHGIKVLPQKIAIQVTSYGCTNINSFKLTFIQETLFIERVKPDHCRRVASKIWLTYTVANMPKQFQLNNKISNE